MTDNEIIKALECCLHSGERCNKCELNGFHDCIALHPKDILDLINYRKAEIEIYKSLYEDLKAEHLETIRLIKKAQLDKIKEFWDKLKQEADFISGGDYGFSFEIREDVANDIIEEMAGK